MWERFSYYGMRAILILFMVAPLAEGGLGFDTTRAGAIYGTYVSMVYLLSLPGGWLADRVLGLRHSILYGGIIIMVGHICLAIPSLISFYIGLTFIALGTGSLKPCVSAIVGELYTADDERRDAGFSIYYMGINIGAFAAPLAVGFLAQSETFQGFLESMGIAPETSWHFGFGLAAIGMAAGLIQYVLGGKHLGSAGLRPDPPSDPVEASKLKRQLWVAFGGGGAVIALVAAMALLGVVTATQIAGAFGVVILLITITFFAWLFLSGSWTPEERRRLVVIALLFVAAVVFWSAFEQAGSSLNLFAENQTNNVLLGFSFPASWFQAVNPLFIIALAPVFALLWLRLGPRNPSTPAKFTLGLLLVGAGFGAMIIAAVKVAEGDKIGPWWLILSYFLQTLGELCLSPVGLSAMTRLAPARISGLMMGVWFLAIALGGYLAGGIVTLYEAFSLPQIFGAVTLFCVGASLVLALFIGPVKRMLAKSYAE